MELPSHEIEKALIDLNPGKYSNTTLSLKESSLLAGWAKQDHLAALSWAWENYDKNTSSKWEKAFLIIGAEWAVTDPLSFVDYYNEHYVYEKQASSEQKNKPKLKSRYTVSRWMIQAGPEAYMRLYHSLPSSRSGSTETFIKSLKTTADFEIVLRSWDTPNLDGAASLEAEVAAAKSMLDQLPLNDPERIRFQQELKWALDGKEQALEPSKNGLAKKVIAKWKKLDPEGFSASPFSDWERK